MKKEEKVEWKWTEKRTRSSAMKKQREGREKILIDGEQLEKAEDYKYLARLLTP